MRANQLASITSNRLTTFWNRPTAVENAYWLSIRPFRYTNVDMTSDVEYTASFYRLKIGSNPTLIRLPMLRISMVHIVGIMAGSVT